MKLMLVLTDLTAVFQGDHEYDCYLMLLETKRCGMLKVPKAVSLDIKGVMSETPKPLRGILLT